MIILGVGGFSLIVDSKTTILFEYTKRIYYRFCYCYFYFSFFYITSLILVLSVSSVWISRSYFLTSSFLRGDYLATAVIKSHCVRWVFVYTFGVLGFFRTWSISFLYFYCAFFVTIWLKFSLNSSAICFCLILRMYYDSYTFLL